MCSLDPNPKAAYPEPNNPHMATRQARDDGFASAHSFVSYAMGMYTYALHRGFVLGTGWAGALRWDKRLVLILVFANCLFAPLDLADVVTRAPSEPLQAGLGFAAVIVSVSSLYKGWVFLRLLGRLTDSVTPRSAPPPPSVRADVANERPSVFMKHIRNIAPPNTVATLRWVGWTSIFSFLSWQVEGAVHVFLATRGVGSVSQNPLVALASGCNFGVHAVIVVIVTMYRLVQVRFGSPEISDSISHTYDVPAGTLSTP